ncbi:hypothetical protein M011DRAFT_54220 [Sporormia fimetaria CBS 119925]|uniref:Uncharacterized protein n=1 Tax=Sporormia fimetaria CBS 119925 TaxID=1340428 RepID=A0A6A6V9R4_9PLEO|nr:hypothetical protein M011DRAFT_54220 [Sporormia fimetaria CBS 119925]
MTDRSDTEAHVRDGSSLPTAARVAAETGVKTPAAQDGGWIASPEAPDMELASRLAEAVQCLSVGESEYAASSQSINHQLGSWSFMKTIDKFFELYPEMRGAPISKIEKFVQSKVYQAVHNTVPRFPDDEINTSAVGKFVTEYHALLARLNRTNQALAMQIIKKQMVEKIVPGVLNTEKSTSEEADTKMIESRIDAIVHRIIFRKMRQIAQRSQD